MPSAKPKDVTPNDEFPLGPGTFAVETSDGRWKAFKHLILIIELLMYMIDGRFNRLMVFCPPRHGKSWLISKYFLSWFIGSFPDLRVILATRDASFSAKWGRITKQLLERYGKKLFVKEIEYEEKDEKGEKVRKRILEPSPIELDKHSNASYRWDIDGHDGGLFTAGIGTGILGEGANGMIIDDPTKGFKKANSKAHQKELNDWWYTEGETRLDTDLITGKKPWVVYIAQRLGKKDLAGQILDGYTDEDPGEPHIDAIEVLEILRNGGSIEPGTWVVLNLPALAGENDILGREPGEPLCEQIKTKEELEQKRTNMGSFRFEAIYQGNPLEREGKIFKAKWFVDERGEPLKHVITNSLHLPNVLNEMRYWDFASSGEEGDSAAGFKSVYHDNFLTFIHLVHDKYTAKQMLSKYKKTTKKDGINTPSFIEQEPGSHSKALIQVFKDDEDLLWYDIQPDKVNDSKADRAFQLEVLAESKRIQFLLKEDEFDEEGMTMAEIKLCINQLIAFTGEEGGEDNIVDCMTGAARYWKKAPLLF